MNDSDKENRCWDLSGIFTMRKVITAIAVITILQIAYFVVMKSIFDDSKENVCKTICKRVNDYYEISQSTISEDWITAGSFGDMFGVLTCLFTGLTVIGLIITIQIQNRTLMQMKKDADALHNREEKHWMFTLIPEIEKNWRSIYNKETGTKTVEEAIECYFENKNDEEQNIVTIWNHARKATPILRQYNIIIHSLTLSKTIEKDDKLDIVTATFTCFPDELQFSILILYQSGLLAESFSWIREPNFFNETHLKRVLYDIYPRARHHQKKTQCLLCKLTNMGRAAK